MTKFLIASIALLISGCMGTFPAPRSPAQAVFELKATEGAALAIAVQYKVLPDCPMAAPLCKTADRVALLQKADSVAATAIDSAEQLVRDPAFKDGPAAVKALDAANAAVAALTAITSTIKVK